MRDRIELTDMRVDTIIGILDAEQRAPQPIRVDLELEMPIEAAARTGSLHTTINYADVQAWVMTLAQQGRWRLLESLCMASCRLLLAPPAACENRGQVMNIGMRVRKPTILDGAIPGVVVERTSAWCDLGETTEDGVTIGTLEATPVQGAWRVVLAANARWTVPATWALHVLGGEGTLDGESFGHGDKSARAPGRRVVGGRGGLAILAVGGPPT